MYIQSDHRFSLALLLTFGCVLLGCGRKPTPINGKSPSSAQAATIEPKTSGNNTETTGTTKTTDALAELAPDAYKQWPEPDAVLFVTGRQNGYIEPCGCTGLDKQKGGIARRHTFIKQLLADNWQLIPMDIGNQVRRTGEQAQIKMSTTDSALQEMKYESVGFGPDDLRLPAVELLSVAASDDPSSSRYVSANVVIFDPSLIPTHKVVQRGSMRIGITNVVDPELVELGPNSNLEIQAPHVVLPSVLKDIQASNATLTIVGFFGHEDRARELASAVEGIDLIIASGQFGEPNFQLKKIDGTQTQMISTGSKGMYAGLVGLFEDKPMKYSRVPLTHEFKDDKNMRVLMAKYQKKLEDMGMKRLGLEPIPHRSGQKFVGSESCAECHQDAFDIWESSPHFNATSSIVTPPEDRGDVPRHFDPECLSCHVTGWNPQGYFPYESGYMNLQESKHLHGNGCENCHGPGSGHVAAEQATSGAADDKTKSLRLKMRLTYAEAREHCMICHDIDNSPDFHEKDAFEDIYWPEIEH